MTTKPKKRAATKPSPTSKTRSVVEPVGILEIAARLDVASDTVQKWRARFADTDKPFPEPRGAISGQPWWHWGDVARWCKATGR